jgi:hypothetical protein
MGRVLLLLTTVPQLPSTSRLTSSLHLFDQLTLIPHELTFWEPRFS